MNIADSIKGSIRKHKEAQSGASWQAEHQHAVVIEELQALLKEVELQDYYDDLRSYNIKPEPWIDRQSGAFTPEELLRPDML